MEDAPRAGGVMLRGTRRLTRFRPGVSRGGSRVTSWRVAIAAGRDPAPTCRVASHGWWPHLAPMFSFLVLVEPASACHRRSSPARGRQRGRALAVLLGHAHAAVIRARACAGTRDLALDVGIGVRERSGGAVPVDPRRPTGSRRGLDPQHRASRDGSPSAVAIGFCAVTPFVEEPSCAAGSPATPTSSDRPDDFRTSRSRASLRASRRRLLHAEPPALGVARRDRLDRADTAVVLPAPASAPAGARARGLESLDLLVRAARGREAPRCRRHGLEPVVLSVRPDSGRAAMPEADAARQVGELDEGAIGRLELLREARRLDP